MVFYFMGNEISSPRGPWMRVTGTLFFFCGLLLAAFALPAHAQDGPQTDGNEIEFWTSGGHGTNGGWQHTGVWTAGFRYGWVITAPFGPGPLRGRFEYAVDAVPVFTLFMPNKTAYGAAVDPFALIWDFDTHGRIVPYIDLDGGALFTDTQAPPGTSRINFTTSGALGVHFLKGKKNWTADVRFMHISNAGLTKPNPGINTIQLRVGLGWFTHPHQ
jgi:hypothetical protein